MHESIFAISYLAILLAWSRYGTRARNRLLQIAQSRGYRAHPMFNLLRDFVIGALLALLFAATVAWPILNWFLHG